MKPLLIPLMLLLSGCATCREHPKACMVGAALVAGSIAVSLQGDHDNRAQPALHPVCAPNCPL